MADSITTEIRNPGYMTVSSLSLGNHKKTNLPLLAAIRIDQTQAWSAS
jgi:hypothetical protein